MARGLTLLNGDGAKYLRLLHQFVSSHRDDPTQVARCVADDDRIGARRLLHTLKGVAGTLGIASVATTAHQLEARLPVEHDAAALPKGVHEAVDALTRALAELDVTLAELGSVVTATRTNRSTRRDDEPDEPAAVRSTLLAELIALLTRNDTAVIDLLDTHETVLRRALGPHFDAISEAARQFDFVAALRAMQAHLGAMPQPTDGL